MSGDDVCDLLIGALVMGAAFAFVGAVLRSCGGGL
jgi:hypothetical protein